jgi:hypothetical protein
MGAADQMTNSSARRIELLDRVDYRLVEAEADKEEVFRLRYDAYLREGAIEPNAARKITDRFDEMPNSWTFGVYFDNILTSSIRISVGSPDYPETPSMDVFPDLLQPEIAKGKILVDPTRFVADATRARLIPELPYMTVRLAYVACSYFNADLGLATVRVEHQAFYRRVFMHTPLTGPRTYPGLIKPICLMAVDFQQMREKVFARYPLLRSTLFERRKMFERTVEHQSPNLSGPEFPFGDAAIEVPAAPKCSGGII